MELEYPHDTPGDELSPSPGLSEPSKAMAFFAPASTWLNGQPYFRLARRFYHRHEAFGPPLLFLGGVGWDAATLRRIDAWFDNVFLLSYLLILGFFVVLAAFKDAPDKLPHPSLERFMGWSPEAVQFLAGALFSAYVVYYSQSASLSSASLFLIFLVTLLVANEFVWSRTVNLYVLFGIYYIAAFCFFTFFLPVMTGTMGYGMFVLSGVISLVLVCGMLYYLHRRGVIQGMLQLGGTFGIAFLLFGLVNVFYVQNWIPPVPLALRHSGVYHAVEMNGAAYQLTYEKPPWYLPWREGDDVFVYDSGDTVHCFTAIFAPTDLKTKIYHRWQWYNPKTQVWEKTDRIGYKVVGGRLNGYRGYTHKRFVRPGEWRVEVETADGLTIGRVHFKIEQGAEGRAVRYASTLYR